MFKEIAVFLGLASYYRKFIKNFSKIASPLTNLMKKQEKFIWTDHEQKAFDTLRSLLMNTPILAFPNFARPFMLQTDASDYAIGAVLSQEDSEHREHPVAFISRTLNTTEQKYSVTEKECLAVVYACKVFRPIIFGKELTIITDHAPLQWLQTHKDSSSRLIRWSLKIQDLNMKITYKPGKRHTNADAMSRLVNFINFGQLLQEQQEDLADIEGSIMGNDGIRRIEDGRILVPPKLRHFVMWEAHNGLTGAHLGSERTISKITKTYTWPKMKADVVAYVKACEICQSRKPPKQYARQFLKNISVDGIFHRVAMDIVGPLPVTHRQNRYILVVQEYLTKYPLAFAIPDQKADTIAQIYVEEVILVYGAPAVILTDLGSNFTSSLMKSVNSYWGIKQSFTTAYHPQCDGMVERFNRTLATMIASIIEDSKKNWDDLLPYVLFAYRTTVHSATGETPFYLMFGRDAVTPSDLIFQPTTNINYVDEPDFSHLLPYRFQLLGAGR